MCVTDPNRKLRMENDMKTKANKQGLMRRFWPYLRKYRHILLLDLFCAALTTLCDMVLPLIMRYLTNTATTDLAALTAQVVLQLGALYLVLRLIDGAANYYMADMGHVMGVYVETDMRRDAFAHLQKLGHTYYSNTKVGQIMGRITNDLFDVTEFAHHCPEEFFIAAIKITASFVILCQSSVALTLILFACVPLMGVVSTFINLKVRAAFRRQRVQIGELNARIEDSLLGERVVKAFANEEVEKEKFEKDNAAFQAIKKQSYRYMAAFQTSTRLFDGLMYLVVIVAGGLFLVYGKIDPGDMVAYMLYVTTLIATIRRIVEFAEQFQRGMTGIERFCEIMDADVEIFDEPDARPLTVTEGAIRLEDVSFEYPDDHNQVLRNVNLSIRPGEKVALVGPSGGGKTTVSRLAARFWDYQKGSITVGGMEVSRIDPEKLMSLYSIVFQDVTLFDNTILENIRLGRKGATDEEVLAAAKLANCEEFAEKLPDKWNTNIGENGCALSGGERQRISIARAFLKDAPIILLDEATASLDVENETAIQEALSRLIKNKTVLIIAHRMRTVAGADRVVVLSGGIVAEQGSPAELYARKGLYTHMVDLQSESQNWTI